MLERVRKTGNSLAVTISKDEAARHDLHEGDFVEIHLNKVTMRPELPRDTRAAFDAVRKEYAEGIAYLADK